MKVCWTRQAEQDRADIMAFIADDNVRAAIAMDELFSSAGARLAATHVSPPRWTASAVLSIASPLAANQ